MQNWFFSKEGRAQGPKTKEQMDELFSSGTLKPEDLIFREGEREWRKAHDFAEFKTLPQVNPKSEAAEPVPLGQVKSGWVLLSKNLEDTQPGKPRFQQSGPFQKDEILERIREGSAKWSDYVWKTGFKSWARISSLPDFNESMEFAKPQKGVEKATEPTGEFLLQNVMKQSHTPKTNPLVEKVPAESTGENLAKPFAALATKAEAIEQEITQPGIPVAEPVAPKLAEAIEPDEEKPAAAESAKPKRSLIPKIEWTQKRLLLYGGTFGVVLLILVASVFAPPKKEGREPASEASAPVTQPAAPVTPPAPTAAANPPAPAPVEKYLRIVPLKMDTEQPQLVFETHAGPGEPISVQVKGRQGQILDRIRFEKSVQVARSQSEVPTLDLSKWDLPQGTYQVEGRVAGIVTKTEIFIGQKNRAFQTQLDKHNQKIAIQAKAERKELNETLKKIEKQIGSLQKGYAANKKNAKKWSAFYGAWSKEVAGQKGLLALYKESQSDRFVNPATIESTKSLHSDLGKMGKSLNDSIKKKRAPASQADFKMLLNRAKQIREDL